MTVEELEKIVNSIDKKEVDRFLIELLMNDEKNLNNFRSHFINHFPKITKREYANRVYRAIDKAAGKDGYIDYDEVWEYTHYVYDFIRESKKLVELKNYESAFDIIEVILNSIPVTNIDDSDGSTGEIASDCIEIIEDILGYTLFGKNILSKRILEYILHEIKTKTLYNYGIELYPLLNYFIDEEKNLSEIKETLQTYLDVNKKDSWLKDKYIEILKTIESKETNK